MTLVSNVLGRWQQHLVKIIGALVLTALLFSTGCSNPQGIEPSTVTETAKSSLFTPSPPIKQVDTPELIQELAPWLDTYEPQVQILEPKAEEVFDKTTVSVVLRVKDLPIYKDTRWEMGPHLVLLLDNQPYGAIYDLDQSITLTDLTPGTHTIRIFAERPWHESFKNEGAYAQATFHIFAKTDENAPKANQPLLTYGAPMGVYGAEPILLDFYLTEAPLHQVAVDNPTISDWRVRYTINGHSITLQDWQPIYIEGLKPGKNWVQLTLVNEDGKPIAGVFNNTVRLIDYDPNDNNSLAKIIRGEVALEDVGGIIDPTYEPPVVEEPEVAAPEVAVPEVAVPEVAVPEVAAPEVIESPTLDEPEVAAPEVAAPSILEKLDKPGELAPAQPETLEQEIPDIAAPEIIETAEPSENTGGSIDQTMQDNSLTEDRDTEDRDDAKVDESDLPVTETTAVPERSDKLDLEISAESATSADTEENIEPSSEALSEQTPITDKQDSSSRRYFQKLYDYSDRAMKNRDRN
ncbi:hypothetical protein [Adonisia turfae]|uniref:FHA domain containing protein n=1 Tax=Adonisia turfae CCMR0081 TaxID=2292702 RepID=A0A6M0RVJ4_9CYAN|nr:hypothetical protein [Adonisia turfae]NEZ59900.1 hypothetical protein [Adonisia turfae CCMR0081]